MARIRTIKPEFWSSPSVRGTDPWTRLLFQAMWNWADDSGRGTANPRELMGFAFPHDEEMTLAEFRRVLADVRRAFGVVFYEVAGRPYYCIPSWDKHQKIDKRSGSRHPAPDDGKDWNPDPPQVSDLRKEANSEKPAEPSTEPAETTPSSRRKQGAGTGEQGNRGTAPTVLSATSADAPLTVNQRSKRLTDAYHQAEPMSKWPAVNGIVKQAIEAARWSDQEIHDALQRLAQEGRSVTVNVLRTELDGLPASRKQPDNFDAHRALADQLRNPQLAIGGNQ